MAKNEKKEKKEKNAKGGITGAVIAALILLLGGGAWGAGLLPGSNGNGNNNSNPSVTEAPKDDVNKDDVSKDDQTERTVIILLNQAEITLDGEVCDTVGDLYTRIKQMYGKNSKLTFEFKEQYSIKSRYDEVVKTLNDLEDELDINIKHQKHKDE